MTASAKRRAQKRRAADREAGRCCSLIVCGCPRPVPAGPSPDPRSLDEKLRTAGRAAPPRTRSRHR